MWPFEMGIRRVSHIHLLSVHFSKNFFFFLALMNSNKYCSCTMRKTNFTVHTLFMGPTTTLFRKKNFKNGSHGTIHTFKNYFVIVFFSFQLSAVSKQTLNIIYSPI